MGDMRLTDKVNFANRLLRSAESIAQSLQTIAQELKYLRHTMQEDR